MQTLQVWDIFLLTNFQKLSAVSNTLMKLTYHRNKQLIWFEGNFEKAAFSR